MEDNPGSIETVVENVEIRCYIERRKREDELLGGDLSAVMLEQDSKVIVPAVSAFTDLLQTVLFQLGYSEVDVLGAKGKLEIKNWKPMTLDAITDHPWAKVGDILSRLSGLTTLRIILCNSSKYAIMDDIKQKLLLFLLKNSIDLLQVSGCPIKQKTLEKISSNGFKECSQISEDIRSSFNKWYQIQTLMFKRSRTHDFRPSMINTFSPKHSKNENYENFILKSDEGDQLLNGNNDGNTGKFMRNHSYDQLLMSSDLSQRLKMMKRHRKYGMALKSSATVQQVHRHINTQGFSNLWKHGRLDMVHKPTNNNEMRCASTPKWNISPRSGRQSIEVNGSRHQIYQTGDNNSKWLDGQSNLKVPQNLDAEEEAVPVLPNKNAVYIIKPLPVSSPCLESMQVVLDGNEEDELLEWDHPENPEPKDLTRIVSSSTSKKDKISEQRYDRFNCKTSSADHDAPIGPTNLKLKASSESSLNSRIYKGIPLKSIGMEESDSSQKVKVHDDDDSYSDNPFDNDSTSEPSTPNFSRLIPPDPFGFLPQFQVIQQHHHYQQQQQPLAMMKTINLMNGLTPVYNPTQPLAQVPFNDYSGDIEHKKRSRIFIDPMTETPKLEEWFLLDSHPSFIVIEKFTAELNESGYRERFPKLEPKNVQLWFKNHRAKKKRQQFECTMDKNKPDVSVKQSSNRSMDHARNVVMKCHLQM